MNQDEVVNYPTEFLNSLDLQGMPPHILTLKIGRACYSSPKHKSTTQRYQAFSYKDDDIEATILNGKFKDDFLLPRIPGLK